MRLLIPIFIGIIVVALIGTVVVLLRRRPTIDVRDRIERILMTRGSNRCVEAGRLLRSLADDAREELDDAWAKIELPLLEALPDCPPDYRVDLINALDAAAKAARRRETAKAISTMRNSMLK